MGGHVVLDTGPLVAFLDRRDPFHVWATGQLHGLEPPLLTCEAVISESLFLLQDKPDGVAALLGYLSERLVEIDFDLEDHLGAVSQLLIKYQDVPMSLADACLVRMSELHDRSRVFTLDSDFKLYRRNGRQTIPLIYPAR